ncbi:serine/threonine-protein kinase PknA [mine drainage metagenome]|uniref:Serine/threonine-protein kinase PknA n=1 Tax=mine drainage metagenome TaxID=410659 RepID=A0A1J5QQ86_9ZZZZ
MGDTQNIALVGALIGDRYRIEALIGRGGMASVYRARDETLGRVVALKIIAPASDDASAVRRERAEIELLASLNHHALVTLFDAGVDTIDGIEQTYLVMELVDGPTLGTRIEKGPIDPVDVGRMAVDLAEALHVVHAKGVVHRDIKPGNVLLNASQLPDREFTAKLADFGIAFLIDSTRLTSAGGLVGTAGYLSPEQARGSVPAPASDVYSLGLVLLEALTRTRAFPGPLMESISARLVGDPPIPGTIGHAWGALLSAMTARVPEVRPSALEVAAAARAIEHDLVTPAPHTPDAGDATVALGAVTARAVTVGAVTETVPLAADGVDPTAILSPTAVARLDRESSDRAAGRSRTTDARHSRRRRRIVGSVIGLLVVGAAALLAVRGVSTPTPAAPVLPAVVEPLGTHLQALMKSVSP